jgi:hypothetical protein
MTHPPKSRRQGPFVIAFVAFAVALLLLRLFVFVHGRHGF